MEFNKIVRLKDIAEVEMGQSPKSEFYNEQEGTPFLQGTRTFGLLYPIIDTYTTKVTKWAIEGDILFSVRAPVGDINIATIPLCIGRGLAAVRSKTNNQKFLFYLLKAFNNYEGHSTGTIFSSINKSTLENLEFAIPEENIQSSIGDFLWSIDEKIELNNNIISNLEQLSQTFFKHWFIDFEFPNEEGKPYKSSGGEMVESELGEIPKGWTVNTLGNIVNVIDNRGKTPPLVKDNFSFPIIDVKALAGNSRVIDYTNCRKFVSAETYKTWFRKGHPESMDTLLSTVGSIGELKLFYYEKGCVAQNVVALRSKDISKLYIYEFMRSIKSDLVTYNIGSVQPSIKVTHIMKKQMLIPPSSILKKYDDLALPITQQIFSLDKEIQILTNLRDTLLPKLLSGEIEIPDDLEV